LKEEGAAAALCKTIFATLRNYDDKASNLAVERAIGAALVHPSFLKPFAGLVAKAASEGSLGELGRQQRLVLTRWSCLIMDHLDPVAFSGAFAKIAQVQGGLLAAAALAQGTPSPRPCSPFQQLLLRRPELVCAYLAHLGVGSKSLVTVAPLAACGLAAELLHHAVAADPSTRPPPSARRAGRAAKNQSRSGAPHQRLRADALAAARAAAMDAYLRVVFGGDPKVKLPSAVGCMFSPLVSTLTHEEFAEQVAPAAVKQLKRSPESALRSTRLLLESAPLDMSRYAALVCEPLLAQVKHVEEWRRADAAGAIAAVARSSTNVDAARDLFDAVRAELEDPKRRPKEWTARAGLFDAMAQLSCAKVSDRAMGSLAAEACACLTAACKVEVQKDAREKVTEALGVWLALLPAALPKETVDIAIAGMKDTKDGHHRSLLRMLAGAFARNPGLAAGGGGALVKLLAPLAKTGAVKPSQRTEGAMALYLIAAAATADDAAAKEATKEKVWEEALRPDATYFAPSAIAKLGAEDAEVLARCVGELLGSHGAHVKKQKATKAAHRVATLLLLHPTPAVRRAARVAIDAAVEAGATAEEMLQAFRHWLHAAEESGPRGWPALSPGEGEGEASGAPAARCGEFPRRLAGAALGVFCGVSGAGTGAAPGSASESASSGRGLSRGASPGVPLGLAGPLLLLAHHPLVAAPDGRRQGAWEALLARLSAAAERVDAPPPQGALGIQVGAMCETIAGEGGLRSARVTERAAAVAAAFAAARLAPDTALTALLPVATALAGVAEHHAVGPGETRIFNCQIGKLSTDQVDVFKPEARPDANGPKKARGKSRMNYGSDDDDDDDDAPASVSLRPSQAAAAAGGKAGVGGKAGAKPGGKEMDKKELARQAQFAEEAAVRARIQDVVSRLTLRLQLTAALMRGGTRRGAAAKCVPTIAAEVLPLLDSQLLPEGPGREAAAAMVVAAAGVPGNAAMALGFPGVPETFAAALRLSAASAGGSAPPPAVDARGDLVTPSPARVAAETATLAAALDAAAEAVEMNDEEPLPPAALSLVFPVCARALLLPKSAPASIREAALGVLAPHAAPGVEGLPRAAAARLMLTVMATGTPALAAAAHALLLDIAAGAAEDSSPAAVAREIRRGLESEFCAVRAAALAALAVAPPILGEDADAGAAPTSSSSSSAVALLFLARYDPDEANRVAADSVWEAYGLAGTDLAALVSPAAVLSYLSHPAASVREAAVGAFADAVAALASGVAPVLAKLFAAFSANAPKAAPAKPDDPFAMAVPNALVAGAARQAGNPQGRATIMRALGAVAPSLTARDLPLVSTFLTKVLGDEDEGVRDAAMNGGKEMIELHGAEHVQQLLGVYEGYFDRQANNNSAGAAAQSQASSDNVRQGVVVFLGALACHLDKEDPKIRQILSRLVAVLSTPSEAVQRSVANCLPSLMPALNDEERRALVDSLLAQVTAGEGYGDRRGAAIGLAGAVKGMGIGSLKGFGVMDAIKAAVEDKKNPDAREGAVMAFEQLCLRLGRLFEPYVIHVLPMLLVCFGDQSVNVREATISAARAVMGQLSAQGVKLVLPALMNGLEDKAWRTKQGSVQLLGGAEGARGGTGGK
jgi:alkylhydroperoxidase/carboxymuconolactone decarboxylase family protein YurZ